MDHSKVLQQYASIDLGNGLAPIRQQMLQAIIWTSDGLVF